MRQAAAQAIAPVVEFLEQLIERWRRDRPAIAGAQQVLRADIGDVARIPVFSEQVRIRLLAFGTKFPAVHVTVAGVTKPPRLTERSAP